MTRKYSKYCRCPKCRYDDFELKYMENNYWEYPIAVIKEGNEVSEEDKDGRYLKNESKDQDLLRLTCNRCSYIFYRLPSDA